MRPIGRGRGIARFTGLIRTIGTCFGGLAFGAGWWPNVPGTALRPMTTCGPVGGESRLRFRDAADAGAAVARTMRAGRVLVLAVATASSELLAEELAGAGVGAGRTMRALIWRGKRASESAVRFEMG